MEGLEELERQGETESKSHADLQQRFAEMYNAHEKLKAEFEKKAEEAAELVFDEFSVMVLIVLCQLKYNRSLQTNHFHVSHSISSF